MGKGVPLKELFNPEHKRYGEGGEFRTLHDNEADVRTIYQTAVGLEGQDPVNWAAGVIMSSEPLLDLIPIMKREQDGQIITQFDYPTCESLGLVKMDFLGLSNLRILEDALGNIEVNRDEQVVLEDLPFDDRATYELMGRGDTLGVFQLDGGGMRSLLRSMRPDEFSDVVAVSAPLPPWPMGADSHNKYARRKNGPRADRADPPWALAEALEPILGETYGLIIYQEQVMAIAQKVAGYSLGQADILRRAMGKKKKSELDKQYAAFEAGMLERGYSEDAITTLWDILLPFSDYAFNKAHSAAYGVVSYWTAYLKAHYTAEYMAALLTSVGDDKDKLAIYLNECRRMKIRVLPPDVNESHANFTPVGSDIRFGLTAIRNVGRNVVDGVVAARESEGRFTDFNDFWPTAPRRRATSASWSPWSRPARSTRWVTAAVPWSRSTSRRWTSTSTSSATRPSARTLFAGSDESDTGFGRLRRDPRHRRVDKMTLLGLRARHARPLRLRPPAPGSGARAVQRHRLHHRPAVAGRGALTRDAGHRVRTRHVGEPADHQAR